MENKTEIKLKTRTEPIYMEILDLKIDGGYIKNGIITPTTWELYGKDTILKFNYADIEYIYIRNRYLIDNIDDILAYSR